MFRILLDLALPSSRLSIPASSSVLFLPNRTNPCATPQGPLFGRFAEQVPFTSHGGANHGGPSWRNSRRCVSMCFRNTFKHESRRCGCGWHRNKCNNGLTSNSSTCQCVRIWKSASRWWVGRQVVGTPGCRSAGLAASCPTFNDRHNVVQCWCRRFVMHCAWPVPSDGKRYPWKSDAEPPILAIARCILQ